MIRTFRNVKWYLNPSLAVGKSSTKKQIKSSHESEHRQHNVMDTHSDTEDSFWLNIPEDIMVTIIQMLSIGDRVRIRAVCKSWRAMLENVRLTTANEAPWLMLPYKPWCKHMSFYSLSEDRIYNIEMPKLSLLGHGGWCCGSCSRGWLVMLTVGTGLGPVMFLLDPISGAIINLPSLKSIPYFFLNFMLILATGQNVSSFIQRVEIISCKQQLGIVVVAIFCFESSQTLAFCRPHDQEWTVFTIQGSNLIYGDILFHKQTLYVTVSPEQEEIGVGIIGHETCHTIALKDGNVQLKFILSKRPRMDGLHHGRDFYTRFMITTAIYDTGLKLVESTSGQLLTVRRIFDVISRNNPNVYDLFELDSYFHTRKFEINVVSDNDDEQLVTSLGDQALFLGFNCSYSLATKDSNANINGNSIYFNYHQNVSKIDQSRECGFFNLEDGRVRRCFPSVKTPTMSEAGWFTPIECLSSL